MENPVNPYASPAAPSGFPPSSPLTDKPPGSKIVAPCPQCRCTFAKPIAWTVWGGAIGPRIFNHVRCVQCSRAFNGSTGLPNDRNIVIYTVVSGALAIAIVVLAIMYT